MVAQKNESGSAHVVVISVLVAVILGLLGFVFWQNFMQKKESATTSTSNAATATTAAPASGQATQPATPAPAATAPADTTKYVVLDTWGVKFPAPTDGTTIQWAVNDSSTIGFSTSNLKTGTLCNAQNGAAGTLVRSTTVPTQKNGVTETVLNNSQPINGYYYAFDMPNGQHCSDTNPSDYDEALRVQGLIKSLVSA